MIETRALRRSSVSRPGDSRTIRQRSRQAFRGDKPFVTYQQVNHRICNFAASDLDCRLLAPSFVTGSRSRQQNTTRNDHKPGLRAVFFACKIIVPALVVTHKFLHRVQRCSSKLRYHAFAAVRSTSSVDLVERCFCDPRNRQAVQRFLSSPSTSVDAWEVDCV